MKKQKIINYSTIFFLFGTLLITGCVQNSSDLNPTDENGSVNEENCFVHLFESDNFDETDTSFILTEPGSYDSLANLPNATKDWCN